MSEPNLEQFQDFAPCAVCENKRPLDSMCRSCVINRKVIADLKSRNQHLQSTLDRAQVFSALPRGIVDELEKAIITCADAIAGK